MLRPVLFLLGLALSACASPSLSASNRLAEGTWTGALVPMNHPDQVTPVSYRVAYPNDALSIDILGMGGETLPTREARIQDGVLTFVFEEPEGGVTLNCALERQPEGGFSGRCTDAEGKWAQFTMTPPAE